MYFLKKGEILFVLLMPISQHHQLKESPGSQIIVQIELCTIIPSYHSFAPISMNQFGAGLILVPGTY